MNLTYVYRPSEKDKIWVNAYFGIDIADIKTSGIIVDIQGNWGNLVSSLNWLHKWESDISLKQTLFFTGYKCDFSFSQNNFSVGIPSQTVTAGYNGTLTLGQWKSGLNFNWHNITPQNPYVNWSNAIRNPERERQRALEASIWSSRAWEFGWGWKLEGFLKGGLYISPESRIYPSISPEFSITRSFHRYGELSAKYEFQHQNLFRTGFSNIGLPVEFWFAAGKHSSPQKSHFASLIYSNKFFEESLYFKASIFYKRLVNQVEYTENILDLINKDYNLDRALMKCSGNNYGASLMLQKQSGKLTGWIGYSFCRALRKEYMNSAYFPSSHERLHELNILATYNLKNWELSGTFVLASGNPFTAPKAFYMVANSIISEFGEYNANRLPPYMRLDLSANWFFKRSEKTENGLNFSIYNVLCCRNSLICRLNIKDGNFGYVSISLPMICMPSISYFHRF